MAVKPAVVKAAKVAKALAEVPDASDATGAVRGGATREAGKAKPVSAPASRREHDLLGERDVPPTPTTASTRCARWRTFRSPERRSRSIRIWSTRSPASSRRPRAPTTSWGCSTGQGARRSSRPARKSATARLHDEFVVDVIQGGAGTSTNMNANEVIANRALELLGHERGDYAVSAPARTRQPEPEHQRRLSDGDQGRAALRHRPADRRDGGAARARSRRRRTSSPTC